MSNTNNQSQDLYDIAGVEDLSHENAAACSGGTAVLYDERDFSGASVTLTGRQEPSLVSFNNKASSILILDGVWRFWTNQNFTGKSITLGPGGYRSSKFFNDFFNDNIESDQ